MTSSDANIQAADERDSSWEDSDPRFLVYIQSEPDVNSSSSTTTYDLTGVDVEAAIRWARETARGTHTIALALVVDDTSRGMRNPGAGRGLVWLLGSDANSG